MKVAFTYDKSDGSIRQQFDGVRHFKIYELENGEIVYSEIIAVPDGEVDTIISLLCMFEVDAVISGIIEGNTKKLLDDEGIFVYEGHSGSCENAINLLIGGKL